MKIAIVGAGAVGGTFGARLWQAGHAVTFVARGDTLRVLQQRGLLFDDLGTEVVARVPAVADLGELCATQGPPDCVIVATKTMPGEDVFEGLLPEGVDIPVVLTQNSVEAVEVASAQVRRDLLLPGVVRGFMHYRGPAEVALTPGPLSFSFGPVAQSGDVARRVGPDLVRALQSGGIESVYREDIAVDVWMKAMFVATFGALGCAARAPLKVLRGALRPQLEALMVDVYRAGVACGVPLPEDAVAQTMAFADRMPPESTTSMQRDFLLGKSCEFDAQLPAVVRMARRHGVEIESAAMVCALVELELARRAEAGGGDGELSVLECVDPREQR